jgi:hypothetical protein
MKAAKPMWTLASLVSLSSVVAGCEPHTSTARARIARELACDEDRTKLRPLTSAPSDPARTGRWHAHGCGRAATYVCTSPMEDCWRQGEVEDDAEGPPLGTSLD